MLIETPDRPSLHIGRGAMKAEPFPADVEIILSAMEAGRHAWNHPSDGMEGQPSVRLGSEERRAGERFPYRVCAALRLFRDPPGSGAWLLYVRDADPRGMGFISQHRLPLGYGGFVELVAPSGQSLSIPVTLLRCREVVPGWYDGAMNFNREQADFRR
jgi:hypothetical protein